MSADDASTATGEAQPAPTVTGAADERVTIRTERLVDPATRVQEGWQIDGNQTNTVALCHLPSMVADAESPLTAPIGRYTTQYLREWAELLEMLGITRVSIHALQRAEANGDRALVGVPDDSYAGDLVPAVAPRLGNTEECARLCPPAHDEGDAPGSLAEADATVIDRWVDVEVSAEGLEVQATRERGDGTTEVVDSLSLPEDDVDAEEGTVLVQLRFDDESAHA